MKDADNNMTTEVVIEESVVDIGESGNFDENAEEQYLNALFDSNEDDVEMCYSAEEISTPKIKSEYHVVTLVRTQPICKAHAVLFDEVMAEAQQRQCGHSILVEPFHDSNTNPIGIVFKMRYLKTFFKLNNFVWLNYGVNPYTAAIHLKRLSDEGVKHIIWIGGEAKEGVESAKKLRASWTESEGMSLETKIIPNLPFKASDMRHAAKMLDLHKFTQLCPGGASNYTRVCMYKDVRAGLGNPTPVVKVPEDLIKIALDLPNNIPFKSVSKFNEPEMNDLKLVVTIGEMEIQSATDSVLEKEGVNDSVDESIRQVIRVFRNWLRFYRFATHQAVLKASTEVVSHDTPVLNVMLNAAAKTSETNIQEYVLEDITPNGVDLRVKEIYYWLPTLVVINDFKNTPRPKQAVPFDSSDNATLTPGTYELVMSTNVTVGLKECGLLIGHPGLVQHGFYLNSRLYESGHDGTVSAVLTIPSGTLQLNRKSIVAKYVTFEAQPISVPKDGFENPHDGQLKRDFTRSGLNVLEGMVQLQHIEDESPAKHLRYDNSTIGVSQGVVQLQHVEDESPAKHLRYDSRFVNNTVLDEELTDSNLHHEVECKFRLTKDIENTLANYSGITKTFEDVYYDDLTTYELAAKDFWLRRRDGKFQLKRPGSTKHDGGISSYIEVTAGNLILQDLEIMYEGRYDEMVNTLETVLWNHDILPFAVIDTTRTSYRGLVTNVSPEYSKYLYSAKEAQHFYTIDVDRAKLHCVISHNKSEYNICEVELQKPFCMPPVLALRDVLTQLKIPEEDVNIRLNGKVIECIQRHNLKCFRVFAHLPVGDEGQTLVLKGEEIVAHGDSGGLNDDDVPTQIDEQVDDQEVEEEEVETLNFIEPLNSDDDFIDDFEDDTSSPPSLEDVDLTGWDDDYTGELDLDEDFNDDSSLPTLVDEDYDSEGDEDEHTSGATNADSRGVANDSTLPRAFVDMDLTYAFHKVNVGTGTVNTPNVDTQENPNPPSQESVDQDAEPEELLMLTEDENDHNTVSSVIPPELAPVISNPAAFEYCVLQPRIPGVHHILLQRIYKALVKHKSRESTLDSFKMCDAEPVNNLLWLFLAVKLGPLFSDFKPHIPAPYMNIFLIGIEYRSRQGNVVFRRRFIEDSRLRFHIYTHWNASQGLSWFDLDNLITDFCRMEDIAITNEQKAEAIAKGNFRETMRVERNVLHVMDESPIAIKLDSSRKTRKRKDDEAEVSELKSMTSKALRTSGRRLVRNLAKLDPSVVGQDAIASALNQAISWQLKGNDTPRQTSRGFSFYSKGYISVDAQEIPLPKVLFDTGASHASYISEDFVNKHKQVLQQYISPHKATTVLGDGKTKCEIKECLRVPCSFMDVEGKEYKGTVKFSIYKTKGTQLIVGAPDICRSFHELVISMIRARHEEISNAYNELQRLEEEEPNEYFKRVCMNGLNIIDHEEVPEPFQDNELTPGTNPFNINPDDIEAPEEQDTPLPCSFTEVLSYLSTTHEEAVQKYFSLLDTNVCPEFAKAIPELIDYLKSPECLKVFVPAIWKGLNVPPIELDFHPDMPTEFRAKVRPINPRIYETAKEEFNRLATYMYVPSTSPYAVNLVVATKQTHPFIRFCGNYPPTNLYITIPKFPIPNIEYSLGKIRPFHYYLDFDMANGYHQLKLGENTSDRLSIVTPFGCYKPLYMPEGISAASQILQMTVMKIFEGFEDWMVVIFDNFLILGTSYEDLFDKLKKVMRRANEYDLVLKMAKSKLGFASVYFFGYVIENGTVRLDEKRAKELQDVKFPTTVKAMQRFLGASNFFSRFIPNYSSLSAPLNDMLTKDFNFHEATWKVDYKGAFEKLKLSLLNACTLHLPDYTKRFVLWTDASEWGVGAVLTFVKEDPNSGESIYCPIGFFSQKFSPTARNWETIKQEAYAIFAAVKHFEYYLLGKSFTVFCDHRNLSFMASSEASIIVRWKHYLSRFTFRVSHVKGSLNVFADMLSRCFDHPEHFKADSLQAMQEQLDFDLNAWLGGELCSNEDLDDIADDEPLEPFDPPSDDDEDDNVDSCRFTPLSSLKDYLEKRHRNKVKETIETTFFDVPKLYTLTSNSLFLRKRNNELELQHAKNCNGNIIVKTVKDFRKMAKMIRSVADIKLNSIAHGTTTADFIKILGLSIIQPLAIITTKRETYTLSRRVGEQLLQDVEDQSEHIFEVIMDRSSLQDPPQNNKVKYSVAKLRVISPGGKLSKSDALQDVMNALEISDSNVKNTRSKIIEFIFRHDKRHYNNLIEKKVITHKDSDPNYVDLVKRNLAQDEQAFREAFDRVHGGNSNLHFGVKRTYQAFSKYYPGHRIPYAVFVEMCATCPLCQEYKIRSMDGFRAVCKIIQPFNFRESVGVDRLSISPASERGNTTLIVIVTMWSKLIFAVPTSEYTAISIARALLKFFSLYGKFNILRSDKGSDIISDAVNQLLQWMGEIDKVVSVTDIHTSNGVEASNFKILQHLGALTAHHKAKLIWDTEEYLSLVLFKLNNSYNSETNTTAFGATFGIYESNTKNHFNFVMKLGDKPSKYVEKVHEHMKLINQITIEYQEKLNQEKTLVNPPDELVNRYVAGDLVMLRSRKLFKDYKLDPEFKGVFEVVQDQTSNQVEIRSVNTGKIIVVFVEDLKTFHIQPTNTNSYIDQAKAADEYSGDQIIIKEIVEAKGDFLKRTTMQFLVKFSDDTLVWKYYDSDLSATVKYEDFIKKMLPMRPYYEPLLYSIADWKGRRKRMNDSPIQHLPAKTKLYTFLVSYSYDWFTQLNLPDISPKQYVVELVSKGNVKGNPKKIVLYCPLFKQEIVGDQEYIQLYTTPTLDNAHHMLVDKNFAKRYPQVMKA